MGCCSRRGPGPAHVIYDNVALRPPASTASGPKRTSAAGSTLPPGWPALRRSRTASASRLDPLGRPAAAALAWPAAAVEPRDHPRRRADLGPRSPVEPERRARRAQWSSSLGIPRWFVVTTSCARPPHPDHLALPLLGRARRARPGRRGLFANPRDPRTRRLSHRRDS